MTKLRGATKPKPSRETTPHPSEKGTTAILELMIPTQYRALWKATQARRNRQSKAAKRGKGTDQGTPKETIGDDLPKLPHVDFHRWMSLSDDARRSEAKRQAREWYADTRSRYEIACKLDDAREVGITKRALIHHRSLTGADLPIEALQEAWEAEVAMTATG